MKQIIFVIMTILFLVVGCSSTPSKSFGEVSESSSSDVQIFTDKFTQQRTYEYKKGQDVVRNGFMFWLQGSLSSDNLKIIPRLIINEFGVCSPNFEIVYGGSKGGIFASGADKVYNKFIFLGGSARLEIIPHGNLSGEITDRDRYYTGYRSFYSMQLTKQQFDLLNKFFSANENIECAAYSTDNKVTTFKNMSKVHQKIFKALLDCVETENPGIMYNDSLTQAEITLY